MMYAMTQPYALHVAFELRSVEDAATFIQVNELSLGHVKALVLRGW